MKISRMCVLVMVPAILCATLILKDTFAQRTPATRSVAAGVAVCDVVEVFNQYEKARELNEKRNQHRLTIQADDRSKEKDIQDKQNLLEGLKEGTVDYEKVLKDILKMTIERKAWQQYEEAAMRRDHLRRTREMYEDILKTIATVARRRGVQVVLYSNRESMETRDIQELLQFIERRKVLYADASVDITEEVLGRVNRTYRAGKP